MQPESLKHRDWFSKSAHLLDPVRNATLGLVRSGTLECFDHKLCATLSFTRDAQMCIPEAWSSINLAGCQRADYCSRSMSPTAGQHQACSLYWSLLAHKTFNSNRISLSRDMFAAKSTVQYQHIAEAVKRFENTDQRNCCKHSAIHLHEGDQHCKIALNSKHYSPALKGTCHCKYSLQCQYIQW